MHAQWESLPMELQDRIVWYLDQGIIYRDDNNLQQEHFSNARLISKAFAAKLRHWLWLFCPTTHPGFAGHFVEGLLRFTAEAFTYWYDHNVPPISVGLYSLVYTQVYYACTKSPPHNRSEALYNALFEKVRDLAMDGTLADMTGAKRNMFLRFNAHVFKYLGLFYVRRLSLPDIPTHMVAAFQAAGV